VSHTAELGGAELFLVDLVKHGPEGWAGCFFSPGGAVERLRQADRVAIELSAGQKLLSIRRGSSTGAVLLALRDLGATVRQVAAEARKYDVICANSQKALFVCALAARLAGRPFVWVLHDIITDPGFSSVNRRAAIIFSRVFATRVVVNSEATGRAFVAAGGQSDKVHVVYNGFDPRASRQYSADRAARLRADCGLDARPIIGLFGRLSAWKGQHVLIEALAEMPEAQAVIVGGALFNEEAFEEEIRARAVALGVGDRIRFLGHRSDVADLMAAVDIVAHSSTAPEPFGRVVVEGMLAGRPVVATRGGGVTEIVKDGETGLLVPPNDPCVLVAALRRCLSDPGLAAACAANGRSDAMRRFSIDATCRAMAGVLDEVC
jgi:glycosyltransferase involved in cell wall biosynthesis